MSSDDIKKFLAEQYNVPISQIKRGLKVKTLQGFTARSFEVVGGVTKINDHGSFQAYEGVRGCVVLTDEAGTILRVETGNPETDVWRLKAMMAPGVPTAKPLKGILFGWADTDVEEQPFFFYVHKDFWKKNRCLDDTAYLEALVEFCPDCPFQTLDEASCGVNEGTTKEEVHSWLLSHGATELKKLKDEY